MAQSFEVVIAGGGVIGSAVAFFLARAPAFSGRILVAERDPSYQFCSTARSAGSIRQQFSTPENVEISLFGIRFLKDIGRHLAVEGEVPELGFKERGYLFLATPEGMPILRENHAVQRPLGADNALLSPGELAERFAWMNVGDLAGGSLGLSMEGWFDPFALLQAFRRKARSLGVEYRAEEVTGIAREGRRVAGVSFRSGGAVSCGALVNAAGPNAGALAALAGIPLPVGPRKRQVFVFESRAELPACPLVIDASGLWFRPEGAGFVTGISPKEGAPDPETWDLEVDHREFEELLWPLLAQRVPAFESLRQTRAWAGHYDYNAFDQNAVLGPHPEIANFYFANGFSGHGLQQSPAVGRALAELLVAGRYESLDLSRFGYSRILENRPLYERNVV